jgi:hypothetical protein
VYDDDYNDVESSVKKFILLNTPVSSLFLGMLFCDFSEELKYNYNLRECFVESPWGTYYLKRNSNFFEMMKRFKVKPILQVNSFDISFHFQ